MRRALLLVAVVATAGLASLLIGAGTGSDAVGPLRSLRWLLGAHDDRAALVVGDLRLGRTAAALVVGAGLGAAGCLLRQATRNPLADPGLLGVNAGAALAVVAGITYGGAAGLGDQVRWALVGALGASAVVLTLTVRGRAAGSPLRLVLVGVALSMTLNGVTALVLLGHAATYDEYRFWTLGSLAGREVGLLAPVVPPVLAGLVLAALLVRPVAALGLGDDVARGRGHRPGGVRSAVAVAVALLTGASVALAGPLVFLGLLAPFAARALVGADVGRLLVTSTVLGAVFLLVADVAGRLAIRPFELPVGVTLAFLGGPVLVAVARRRELAPGRSDS